MKGYELPLKLRDKYTFDQLSLGEIMLRLDGDVAVSDGQIEMGECFQ